MMTTADAPADTEHNLADASAFRRLTTLFRLAEGAWALAVYESGEVQHGVVRRLREALAPLEVVEVSLSEHVDNPHPLSILEPIGGAPVVSFSGVGLVMPTLGRQLDLQREGLARLPHRLLFWATAVEQESLREDAPNFYSRFSAIFHFPGLRAAAVVTDPGSHALSSQTPDTGLVPRLRSPVRVAKEAERGRWIEIHRKRVGDLLELRDTAVDLAHTWYDLAGLYEDSKRPRWRETEAAYLEAARRYAAIEQSYGQANALLRAGLAARRLYDHRAAIEHISAAREIFEGQPREVGVATLLLGELFQWRDLLRDAERSFLEAQKTFQAAGFRLGEANVLQALGDLFLRTSRLAEAERSYGEALPIYREIEARLGEANVLKALGDVFLRTDRLAEAERSYGEALPIYREIEARLGEANVLKALGDLFLRTSRLAEAERSYGEALPIYREIEARLGEANVLRSLCSIHLSRSEPALGFARCLEALALHRDIADRLGEGADHGELARTARAAGHHQRAAVLGGKSLDLARSAGNLFNETLTLKDVITFFLDLDDTENAEAAALLAWHVGAPIQVDIGDAIALLKRSRDGFDPTVPPSEDDLRAAEERLQAALRRHAEELEARGEDVYSPLGSSD